MYKRQIHSGLPALIVDTLTGITMRDMNGIKASEMAVQTEIDDILKDNEFTETLKNAIRHAFMQATERLRSALTNQYRKKPLLSFSLLIRWSW